MRRAIAFLCIMASFSVAKGVKLKKDPQPSPIDIYIEEATRHATSVNPGATGSLWSPEARFSDLAVDLRANRVNDIVTVLVVESASAVSTGATKTGRTSSAKASVTALAGIPKAAATLPNLLKTSGDQQLDGNGTTSRTTVLKTTLSARVTHVLPNGNLVIEGIRNVTVNSENQTVTVRGVVRPIDLDTGNTVLSSRLAQMEIKINGKGVLGDAIRRPNILYRILLGLLPF